jgi:hypothetical protein
MAAQRYYGRGVTLMSEIKWEVGKWYEDREGTRYKLLLKDSADLSTSQALVFAYSGLLEARFKDGRLYGHKEHAHDIIKRAEPRKVKKTLYEYVVKRVSPSGLVYYKKSTSLLETKDGSVILDDPTKEKIVAAIPIEFEVMEED